MATSSAHCFLYFLLVYLVVTVYFENIVLQEVNYNLSKALHIVYIDLKVEHKTLLACEAGELEAYRDWNKRLLGK